MRRIPVLLAVGVVWLGVAATAAPRIAVDLATYSYPDTVEGIAVVHTFVLSNVGDQELVISKTHASCHCTTVDLAQDRLQPGESVGLTAVLDTEGFSGRVVRTITVTSSDPGLYGNYELVLSLAGNVTKRQSYQTSVSDLYYDSYVLLDVRDAAAYAAGHLVGAMNVPAAQVTALVGGLPPDALTVFYDQNGSSSALTSVTQTLHGGGLATVYALRGGLDQWAKSYGSARMTSGSDASWGAFLDSSGARAYSSSGTVQYYDVTQLRTDYILVDLRAASEFAAAHLAGAVNLPEASLSAYVEALPRQTPVIVYCADGTQSDRVVYGLWMRGTSARSLLGGLAEWQKQHGDFLLVASGI